MCELCEKIETRDGYSIYGSWANLVFEKEEYYAESPYKVKAYGEGVASMEIFYCPLCGKKFEMER